MRYGHHERGEVSIRLIVGAALVAGLIWTVPTVFFGREATKYVGDLTGGSDLEPTDGVGVPGAPKDPIGRANDAQAQASLNNAIRVAQVFYAENGSFAGFGPQVAAQYDPTLMFTTGPAVPGVVSLRGLSPTTVVFVTGTDSGYLCAAAQGEIVAFGRSDAQSPSQCTGGWA
ncbi:MAG: hypothetical protein WD834_07415 [Actinomycetota bacterium]